MNKLKKQFSCPECGSKSVITRSSGVRVCNRCGYRGPAEEFEVVHKPEITE